MLRNDPDWQRFYGNEGLWRNDNNAQDRRYDNQPTVSIVITHAEDKIRDGKHYGFGIRHVRGFHGKGFMPFIWFLLDKSASGGNGELYYGTGQEAYDKALANGQAIIDRADADMEKSLEESERLSFFRPFKEPK